MFEFILKPIRKRFGKDKYYYAMADLVFGIYPNNIELYKLALIHRSASFVMSDGTHINNERLEYLGDSILQAVVTDFLYVEFPEETEGFLTQTRAKIVSRSSLNELSQNIGLSEYIVKQSGLQDVSKNICGDAFEAMIGAIYLDKGYNFVNRLLINQILRNNIDLSLMSRTEYDFKSRLIEWCQKNRKHIVFRTKHSPKSQPNTPYFNSTILIDGLEVAYGEGSSKKEAEQFAASNIAALMSDINSDELLEFVDRSVKEHLN